mmetsp:Transcript_31135/g.87269  ORF Transcript_31135/g.87269 Transcript_31135/m.87269 type:complete len:229 (+) Transcript_31135:1566-2252(+)
MCNPTAAAAAAAAPLPWPLRRRPSSAAASRSACSMRSVPASSMRCTASERRTSSACRAAAWPAWPLRSSLSAASLSCAQVRCTWPWVTLCSSACRAAACMRLGMSLGHPSRVATASASGNPPPRTSRRARKGSRRTAASVSSPWCLAARCASAVDIPRPCRKPTACRTPREASHPALSLSAVFLPIPFTSTSRAAPSAPSSTSRVASPKASTMFWAITGPTPLSAPCR